MRRACHRFVMVFKCRGKDLAAIQRLPPLQRLSASPKKRVNFSESCVGFRRPCRHGQSLENVPMSKANSPLGSRWNASMEIAESLLFFSFCERLEEEDGFLANRLFFGKKYHFGVTVFASALLDTAALRPKFFKRTASSGW